MVSDSLYVFIGILSPFEIVNIDFIVLSGVFGVFGVFGWSGNLV